MKKTRLQIELTPDALKSLEELQKQLDLLPTRTQLIRNAMAWRQPLLNSDLPFVLEFENGKIERNEAAQREVARLSQVNQDLAGLLRESEKTIRQRDESIRVLTVALSAAQQKLETLQTPAAQAEVEETSLLLTLWNSTSIKPGIGGISVDMKQLISRTKDLLERRAAPIGLGLNFSDDE
jgi:hypothetical protein